MLTQTSEFTGVLIAPNPGPMTLAGTNSFVLASPGCSGVVVVDPGPDDADHVDRLASVGRIDLVLVTHRHDDHVGAVDRLIARTGAPVRAADRTHCRGAAPLVHGEVIEAAGLHIRVMRTPGHTADSVSFHLPDDGPSGSVLCGDTILGRGTTMLAGSDGALDAYLRSLWALRVLGPATVLPGHGPIRPDLVAACDEYLAHRMDELRRFTQSLAGIKLRWDERDVPVDDATVARVTDALYQRVHPRVREIAEISVRIQLNYLRGHSPALTSSERS